MKCPKKVGGYASCVLEDKLYVIGGSKNFPWKDSTGQKEALMYDPATDAWTYLPEMSHKRGSAPTAVVFDGKIYVIQFLED